MQIEQKKRQGLTRYIFFLLMTTTGCSYFALPYFAKRIGLLQICCLLSLPPAVSYFSSLILYQAFRKTKAKSYDECCEILLGKRNGIMMNFIVFVHHYATVTQSIFFSSNFMFQSIIKYIEFRSSEQLYYFMMYFRHFFVLTCVCIMYLHSVFGHSKSYKKFAIYGILIMLGILFTMLQHVKILYVYHNSKEEFNFNNWYISRNFTKAFGMINLIFVNSCQIFPICNNIKNINVRKLKTVILGSIILLYIFYQTFTIVGYFSLPKEMKNEYIVFTNRPVPPEFNDLAIWVYQLLLGYNLALILFIKAHRYCGTFKVFLKNSKYLFIECKPLVDKKIKQQFFKSIMNLKKLKKKKEEQQNLQTINSTNFELAENPRKVVICEQSGSLSSESETDFLDDIEDEQRFIEAQQEKQRINRRISIFAMGLQEGTIKEMELEDNYNRYFVNFAVLFTTALISIFFQQEFVSWLAILGFTLVILEVVIYPLRIMLEINRRHYVYSKFRITTTLAMGIMYGSFCFFCTCKLIYYLIFQLINISIKSLILHAKRQKK